MSKAPKVVGFKEISFWQEDGIGVIAILTGEDGKVTMNFFDEFLRAITLAITDEKVRSLAITGTNDTFLNGVRDLGNSMIKTYLELTSATASFLSTMDKPIISIINGNAQNLGVELALLSDVIISKKGSLLEVSGNYEPVMGFSLSSLKYSFFKSGEAEEKSNCDIIMEGDDFLEKASVYIRKLGNPGLNLLRRNRLKDIRNVLSTEREYFLLKAL